MPGVSKELCLTSDTNIDSLSQYALSTQQESKLGDPRSFISDKFVYSEPDGTVLWRAGDHVYVSPGVSDFQLSAVH